MACQNNKEYDLCENNLCPFFRSIHFYLERLYFFDYHIQHFFVGYVHIQLLTRFLSLSLPNNHNAVSLYLHNCLPGIENYSCIYSS